jgi:hypothetical protein
MGGLFGIGVYQPVGNTANLLTLPTGATTVDPKGKSTPSNVIGFLPNRYIGKPPKSGIHGITTFFYLAAIQALAPRAYYVLDDVYTSQIYDYSGHGQGAQIPSSAASGVMEGQSPALSCTGDNTLSSMTFNGKNGSITLPTTLDTTTFSALSIVLWVRPLAGGSGTNQRLVANSHTDIDKKGFQLFLQGDTQFIFNVGTGSALGTVNANATAPKDTWTMLTATWNPATGVQAVYINAIQQATNTFTGTMASSPYPIMLARDPAYSNTDFYCGGMAHAAIFDVELSPQTINNLYLLGINQGATLVGSGWQQNPTQILPPFSGIYGGPYGYVLDTTIRAPKFVQYSPAQTIGNDSQGSPVVRSYPQMVWQYSTMRPDYWFYLKNLYKLSGNAPPGYQYLVLLQYPDQSGNNEPIQVLARWDPPTQGQRQVGAYYNATLKFTYLGQAQLSPGVQVVVLV